MGGSSYRAAWPTCGPRKNGLSEDEMIDVLSRDEEVFDDFRKRSFFEPPEKRLPVVVWSRFYFDVEPYLNERSADGASLAGLLPSPDGRGGGCG